MISSFIRKFFNIKVYCRSCDYYQENENGPGIRCNKIIKNNESTWYDAKYNDPRILNSNNDCKYYNCFIFPDL
jgi:hypothetical protein